MTDLDKLLQQCGRERTLAPGEVVCRQGAVSDGAYYVKRGRLGVYREDQGVPYFLSEITPGNIVGELGATTGWSRTATVKAEEESCVIHISEADFRRLLKEAPALAAEVIYQVGERLIYGDIARVTLGRSYQQAMERVQALRSEKERLEELLRLREELANMIMHDLRNPLGVMSGGMELLDDELEAETKSEYVDSLMETMKRSVWRMQRLVETLLDITRLEEGRMALHLAPVGVIALIEEVVTEERHLAANHGVALESIALADIPLVMVDRDVVQRMLINLLDNALKFTPRGGRVWVDARLQDGQVQVDVVDTGPGIPLEERERIFEKFTQVQGRIGGLRGLGLGLAFCRMAVEAHGGSIWVEDGPQGNGSRFVFTLPRSQEDAVR